MGEWIDKTEFKCIIGAKLLKVGTGESSSYFKKRHL